jgi:hypothetical protein
MRHVQRFVSVALLMLGVALVFLGLMRSVGFTPLGVIASVAAIAALLYTGGVWFGGPGPRRAASVAADVQSPMLFDASGRLIAGPAAGHPVASQFPESLKLEIERHCAEVFAGQTARFPCARDGQSLVFDVLPIQDAAGTVIYGIVVPLAKGTAPVGV